MKKLIHKIIIVISLVCVFQVKLPYFHMAQPSTMQGLDFISPYSDVPAYNDNTN